MKRQRKSGWRHWHKASKRINREWHKQLRRDLDRHDYWTAPTFLMTKRRSQGRDGRYLSWLSRQPFTGRHGWLGQVVCHRPGVNMTVSL